MSSTVDSAATPYSTDSEHDDIKINELNPFDDVSFYLDPRSGARAAANAAHPPSPELNVIADTPQAYWLDEAFPITTVTETVHHLTSEAAETESLLMLSIYAIPHRDCGSFAAGGFATAEQYRAWIDTVADALQDAPVAIVLEPDALDMADCLSPVERTERFDLISYAIDSLNRDPASSVYVDAGNSRWKPAEEIAARLNQVGVSKARGFSLNTSNFYTTEEETGYGEEVSALTGGSHYIIDTGRNGLGPLPEAPLNWCNPPGRGMGSFPTTQTEGEHADAYVWIKRPGESDGTCDRGDPRVGLFVNRYAIELVQNAPH